MKRILSVCPLIDRRDGRASRFAVLASTLALVAASFALPATAGEPDLTTTVRDLLESNTDGEVGLYLKEVDGPVLAAFQEDFQTYPASTIKVLHHLHALRAVEAGTFDLDLTELPVCLSCKNCNSCPACPAFPTTCSSPPPNPCTGVNCTSTINCSDAPNDDALCSGQPPTDVPLRCVLQRMMIPSDNRATNAIQELFGDDGNSAAAVGRDDINATAALLGMSDTVVNHKFACGNVSNNPFNVSTLADLALLYEKVATDDSILDDERDSFYQLMLNESFGGLTNDLNAVIDQETLALGLSPADADVMAFKSGIRLAYKAGNVSNSNVDVVPRLWASIAGWVEFPEIQDPDSCDELGRHFTFGLFVDNATTASNGFDVDLTPAAGELFRSAIRDALEDVRCARAPQVVAPTPLKVECNEDGGVAADDPVVQAWLDSALAIDACGDADVAHDAPDLFPASCQQGTSTPVTFTGTDVCGNETNADSSVDVQDTTPPAAAFPDDVVVECTGPEGAEVDLFAMANDVCGDEFFLNSRTGATADASGTFPLGETVVAWDVFDECDNHTCGWTTVTVQDLTPPEVDCAAAETTLWPPNNKLVDIGLSWEVHDDCDPDPEVEIRVTSDEHPATAPGAGGPQHCPDAEICDGTVELRAERSGPANGRVYVVTVTATDAAGNAESCEVVVSVPKSQGAKGTAQDSGQDYDPTLCDPGNGKGNGNGNGPPDDPGNGGGNGPGEDDSASSDDSSNDKKWRWWRKGKK